MKENSLLIKRVYRVLILFFVFIFVLAIRIPVVQNILLTFAGFLMIQWLVPMEMKNALFLAYVIRILFLLFNTYAFHLPLLNTGDATMYDSIGLQWSQNGVEWVLAHFTSGAFMYSWFIAIVYYTFGYNPFIVQFINVMFGTFTIFYVYLITEDIFSEEEALITSYISSIFPSFVYFSLAILREAPIVFFFTGGVHYFIKWLKNGSLISLVVSEGMFVLSVGFHTGALVSLFVVFLINLFLLLEWLIRKKKTYIFQKSAGIFVSLFFIWFEFETRFGFEKLSPLQFPTPPTTISNFLGKLIILIKSFLQSLINYINKMQIGYSYGRAVYLPNFVVKSFPDLVLQIPVRLFYFLFSLFLWMIKEPIDLLGFFDAIFYIIIVVLILLNIKKLVRKKETLFILILLFAEFTVFGLITSNYGSALRHRAKFVGLLIILASPTVKNFLERFNTNVLWRRNEGT
ncbi:ArnT family glycosyltransferase [Caldisericum exile]|uniref:Glycosyltransferase n=1 Tax=Caldisericum exile (strain DSM 21853 / NBRC 104410 / AZM16c01) TaxID=511051 RepID=A0A7U6GFW1_CALEA|nr:glycosyltransferase family 39 protein [Caldisericum exile]BAL81658.1 putative glycosyltransferase [Caldisericum exile AZM16c01]